MKESLCVSYRYRSGDDAVVGRGWMGKGGGRLVFFKRCDGNDDVAWFSEREGEAGGSESGDVPFGLCPSSWHQSGNLAWTSSSSRPEKSYTFFWSRPRFVLPP